jgi:WD40 repeat protein
VKSWASTPPKFSYAGALSPDGTRVVTGFNEGTIVVWKVETGKAAHVFKGHNGTGVVFLAFTPMVIGSPAAATTV